MSPADKRQITIVSVYFGREKWGVFFACKGMVFLLVGFVNNWILVVTLIWQLVFCGPAVFRSSFVALS